jgi:hypothetical protein
VTEAEIQTTLPTAAIEAARQRRAHELALAADKRAARREKNIHEAAAEYLRHNQLGARSHCRICERRLTDEPSIQRGIGPECWDHILNRIEWLKSRALTRMQFAARWFVIIEARRQEEKAKDARHALSREQWIAIQRRQTRVGIVEPSMKLVDYADTTTIAATIQALKDLYREKGKAMAGADDGARHHLQYERREIKKCIGAMEAGYIPAFHWKWGETDEGKLLALFIEPYQAARNAAWDEANHKTEELQAATDYEALWREYVEQRARAERAETRHAQMLQTIVEIENPGALR